LRTWARSSSIQGASGAIAWGGGQARGGDGNGATVGTGQLGAWAIRVPVVGAINGASSLFWNRTGDSRIFSSDRDIGASVLFAGGGIAVQ
jgi:hypothetical protein